MRYWKPSARSKPRPTKAPHTIPSRGVRSRSGRSSRRSRGPRPFSSSSTTGAPAGAASVGAGAAGGGRGEVLEGDVVRGSRGTVGGDDAPEERRREHRPWPGPPAVEQPD